MNYPSRTEYFEAIKFADENFDQLKNLRPVLGEDGEPVITNGNFAVVFKMKDEKTGKVYAVKCFTREQEGRAEAYRQIAEELEYVSSTFLTPIKYLDKELFVDTNASDDTEFPVLLMDWVEGETLDKYIRKHLDDQYELSLLAYQFSRLAMWLMPQPFAHGDLKPDNILVKDDGTLVLVDYDGMYVPAMKGQKARELGSPDFRHPSRTEIDFDEHIDDFSLASILLSLKAISLQPSLLEEYGASDRLLFSEKDYRNLSESKVMDAMKPLMQDEELASLISIYNLSLFQKNLSSQSLKSIITKPEISQFFYKMYWDKNDNKLSALHYYQHMGFKCSFIEGNSDDMDSYKNPSCIANNVIKYDLDNYTGIGVHLGEKNDYRAIDIDDFQIQVRGDLEYSGLAETFFIKKCMDLLGLPEDYEWIIRTPHGWHIIISAPSFGFKQTSYCAKDDLIPNVISGHVVKLRTIELLWEGFLVMPPSEYGKYKWYRYYNQQPKNSPARVGASQILEFLCFYCGKYKYITDLTTSNLSPIIGNAHLFPCYELNFDYGSQYYEDAIDNLSENKDFLRNCKTSLGYNMLGFRLVYNDLVSNFKVEKGLNEAIKCFRMANNGWGHYNLACLMAIGSMNGSIEDFYNHLELSKDFPDDYKDQLKMLYLSKNHSYEKYAIIDIGTNKNQRIEKIAIIIADIKGNVLDRRFLSFDSVMLNNMYYALRGSDYIVGYDVAAIENSIREECEIYGYSFSEDMIGVSSDKGLIPYHSEGYYLDAFRRPWINLPSINCDEKDPFRRVYKLKDVMVQELNRHNK